MKAFKGFTFYLLFFMVLFNCVMSAPLFAREDGTVTSQNAVSKFSRDHPIWILMVVGVVLAIIAIFIFWNRTLTRKVRDRTATLTKSEQRFRSTFEQAAVGIAHVSPKGRFLRINQKFCDIVGYSHQEMFQRTYQEITFSDDLEADVSQANQLLSGEIDTYAMDKRYICKNGELVWVNLTVALVRNEEGQPQWFVAVIKDISERKLAEEKIKESEEKYMTMVEYSNDMIWTLDKKGNFTYFNKKSEEITGYKIEEELNKGFFPIILEEDLEMVYDVFRRILQGKSLHYEVRIHGAGRKKLIILAVSTAPIYKDKEIIGTVSFGRDITERKRLEESLRRREAILQAVAYAAEHFLKTSSWEDDVDLVLARLGQASQVSRVYVFKNHTDATGEFLASQRYEWVAPGVTAQLDNPDLRGISWSSGAMRRAAEILSSGGCVSGHVKDSLPAEQEMMSTQDIQSMVVVPVFADGEWWGFIGFDECLREREWFAVEINALKAGASTLGAAIHRKRVEDALKESEKRFRDIADNSLEWIWEVDSNGKYTYVSPAVERALGHKPEEILQKHFYDLFCPDDKEEMKQAAFEMFASKKGFREFINRNVHKNGKVVWLSTSGIPIIDERGKLVGYRGADTDITERKKSEEDLRQVREQLLHTTRRETMGELSSAIAHELNQPLAAIMSNTQAAQRFLNNKNPPLEKVKEILSDIVNNDRRAGDVIRKLRLLLKKDKSEFAEININDLVKEVLVITHSNFVIKNIVIKKHFWETIPPVFGDKTQLQQVLLNFILNSLDSFKDAKKDIKQIDIITKYENEKEVCVAVKDSGCGIDKSILDGVFKPFVTTKDEGMGMGLAINKTIIQAHGGRIWAENNPDQGATFYIVLPIKKEEVT